MKKHTIEELIKLNIDFYKKTASEFDVSRQYSWRGWESLSPILNSLEPTSKILDIGCGNGRFLKLMFKVMKSVSFSYLGIDNNKLFLSKIPVSKEIETRCIDIYEDLSILPGTYNLVACFGITHHIPGRENRLNWFNNVSKLVTDGGYLVFTNWELRNDVRSGKLLKEISNIKESDLEEGDFFYTWKNKSIYRYVHFYTSYEMSLIIKNLVERGFELIDTYTDDGKDRNLNTYYIFKKL